MSVVNVRGFLLAPGGRLLDPAPWPKRRMLFVGDSVTCGERIDRQPGETEPFASSNGTLSYGMRLARALDAQCHLVCYGGRGLVRDWRGRTDVLTGPQLFDLAVADEVGGPPWDHASYIPDVVFVSLGTNDFNLAIGPLPEREPWVSAYVTFVRTIRSRYPDAHVFLTEGAIVSDADDPKRPRKTVLREYLAETARRLGDPRVHVVPSQHYPGDPSNAHPTGEQHAAMARDLEPVIREVMGWSAATEPAVPVDQEPVHKVVLKNDYVTVLHVTIPPGQSTRAAHALARRRRGATERGNRPPGRTRAGVHGTAAHVRRRDDRTAVRGAADDPPGQQPRHDPVRGHRHRVPEAPGRPADGPARPSRRREPQRPRLPLGPRPGSLNPAAHPRAPLPDHRGDADAALDEVPDGASMDHPIKAGDFHWIDSKVTHVLTNSGTEAGVIVEVELK